MTMCHILKRMKGGENMVCKKCGTVFEGNLCPSCMTPVKKPIYKKWWFWLIIAVVIIGIIGSANSSPKKETGNAATSNSSTASQNSDSTFSVGDTAVFKNIKVTATEIQSSTGKDFYNPEAGKVFVGVNFTIENTSDKDVNMSSILLFDGYVDDVKCDYSFTANCCFGEGTLDGTISPGKKMVGWYAVEIPESWNSLELHVSHDWLASNNNSAQFVFNK